MLDAQRFWSKVARRAPGECWEWIGSRFPRGYGRLKLNRKTAYAHRVSWELAHGVPVPDGLCVLHRCDNPPCVNPAHLWSGTMADNMHDRDAKGRGRWGPNRPNRPER